MDVYLRGPNPISLELGRLNKGKDRCSGERLHTSWFEVLYEDVTFECKLLDQPEERLLAAMSCTNNRCLLSTLRFAEVDSDALLVSRNAPPPWADTVLVQLTPDA